MPTYIKTGFWEKAVRGAKGWLDLDLLIQSIGGSGTWGNITGNIADQTDLQTVVDTKKDVTNTSVALVDNATLDLSATNHNLTSSLAAITFTISYLGDEITLEVTLNAVLATYTFPSNSLCISEGSSTGSNSLSITGSSGDKYLIGIKNINNFYYIVAKNFGQ